MKVVEPLSLAQRALAERHRSLAMGIARTHAARHRGIPFDELRAAAELGLVQAARSFVADEGATFETYAFYRVAGAVRDALRQEAKAFAIRRAAENAALALAAGQDDDGDPLHDDARATRGQLGEKAAAIQGAFLAGLAAAAGTLAPEALAAENAGLVRTAALVREVVASLPERDRLLIEQHYFASVELKVLSDRLGVSYTTTRRIHQDALGRLAKRLLRRGVQGAR